MWLGSMSICPHAGNAHHFDNETGHTNMLWHYGTGTHKLSLATAPLRLDIPLEVVTTAC